MHQHKLSIAMIADDFVPGMTGVGIHVQRVSRELVARGYEVVVITTRRDDQPEEEVWEGIKVYRVFSLPIYGFYQALPSLKKIEDIFVKHTTSIVHCHYLSIMMLLVLRKAKKMGIPTVITAHMTVDVLTQPPLLKPWRAFLSRCIALVYEQFNDVICVSTPHAMQVRRFNISSRVHHISNAIDFNGTEADFEAANEKFQVLFVGRLTPEKNVPLLLNAFALLVKENPNVELFIVGMGTSAKELQALSDSLGLNEHVRFLGHRDHKDLPRRYASCDVFVLPSTVETQGLVAMEAMRFKRPVIVTNKIISAQELIDDGVNGFIVDAYDPKDLAQRLNQLRLDPTLRQNMGKAGFEKSAAYTLPGIVDAMEKVYTSFNTAVIEQLKDLDIHVEQRDRCVFCQVGTFARRKEHIIVRADAKQYQDEYFVIWRCAFCQSLHSLAKFSLDDYYRHSPFLKRKVNPFNRHMFLHFYKQSLKQGLKKTDRLLFCGVSASLFKEVFEAQGQSTVDVIDQPLSMEALAAAPSGNYDAMIVMEHLECAEDPEAFLEYASRQLRPGGLFIIHTPDARKIALTPKACWLLHQPYRIHIAAKSVFEKLAAQGGFTVKAINQEHYMDTDVPFINFHTFQLLPYFGDKTVDSAIAFKVSDIWKAWWLIPRFLFWGFMGSVIKDRNNLTAVFHKNEQKAKDQSKVHYNQHMTLVALCFSLLLLMPHQVFAGAAVAQQQQMKAMQEQAYAQAVQQAMVERQKAEVQAYQQAVAQYQYEAAQYKAAQEYMAAQQIQQAIAVQIAQQIRAAQVDQIQMQMLQQVVQQRIVEQVAMQIQAKQAAEVRDVMIAQAIQEAVTKLGMQAYINEAAQQKMVAQTVLATKQISASNQMQQFQAAKDFVKGRQIQEPLTQKVDAFYSSAQSNVSREVFKQTVENVLVRKIMQKLTDGESVQLSPEALDVSVQEAASMLGVQSVYSSTAKAANAYEPALGHDVQEVVDIEDVWKKFDKNSKAWRLLIDDQAKVMTVGEFIDRYRKRKIRITKSPSYYAQMVDDMAMQNPGLLDNPFMSIIQILAVMEYDFDYGGDRDALARKMLGPMYESNKQRLSASH